MALPPYVNLEVVTLPVVDVDRSEAFYQSLGWRLDIDAARDDLIDRVTVVRSPISSSGMSRSVWHLPGLLSFQIQRPAVCRSTR
jgi:catechol 2,3-dioxygenase-like lactoylglutathione lyase family enzyme